MKRLLMTTSLVAFAALPVAAQTTDAPQTGTTAQTGQVQTMDQAQQGQGEMVLGESFQASDLIGKRIFMEQQGGGQAGAQTQTDFQTGVAPGAAPGVAPGTQTPPQTGAATQGTGVAQTDPTVGGTTATQPGQPGSMAGAPMRGQARDGMQMVGVIRDVILNADGDADGLIVDAGGYLGTAANEIRISMDEVRFVPDHHAGQRQTGAAQTGQTETGQTQTGQTQTGQTETGQTGQAQTGQQQPGAAQTGQTETGQTGQTQMGQQQTGQPQTGQQPVGDAFTVIYTGDAETFQQAQPYDQSTATNAGEIRGSTQWGQAEQRQQREIQFSDLTTDELLGAPVYGTRNEWIAEVSELALGEDGEIESVIIDVGGFLGIGTKPVALPMEEVQLRVDHANQTRAFTSDELRAYVPYTEEQLEAMEEWHNPSNL
ncbi:MAG: PRC-barrel domain-containing protein [Rhodobacterales bacterium]